MPRPRNLPRRSRKTGNQDTPPVQSYWAPDQLSMPAESSWRWFRSRGKGDWADSMRAVGGPWPGPAALAGSAGRGGRGRQRTRTRQAPAGSAAADLLRWVSPPRYRRNGLLLAQAVPPVPPSVTLGTGLDLTGGVVSYRWPAGGPPEEMLGPSGQRPEPGADIARPGTCRRCGKPAEHRWFPGWSAGGQVLQRCLPDGCASRTAPDSTGDRGWLTPVIPTPFPRPTRPTSVTNGGTRLASSRRTAVVRQLTRQLCVQVPPASSRAHRVMSLAARRIRQTGVGMAWE